MRVQQAGIMGDIFFRLINGQLVDGEGGSLVIVSGFGFGRILSMVKIGFGVF